MLKLLIIGISTLQELRDLETTNVMTIEIYKFIIALTTIE